LVLLHQICLVYPAFSGEAFLAKLPLKLASGPASSRYQETERSIGEVKPYIIEITTSKTE